MSTFVISGQLIDVFRRKIYPAMLSVDRGIITHIVEVDHAPPHHILPGFVDAHIHIESSMLVPTEFARLASIHGTVATVSDPHEIANVCGEDGVAYMIANARNTAFKFFFGAPSCVPATGFETAGATIDADGISRLMQNPDIWYLAEVMNYPGVLHADEQVIAKLAAAKKSGKPIDGHAPGLKGQEAARYAAAGITTDHECFTLEEALDKIAAGMKILIREGSAAKNFDALHPLLRSHPGSVMLCSDDKHPDELVLHHLNETVKRALKLGYNLYDVLRAACVHPVWHYNLPVGLLREHEPADFIVIDDPEHFNILKTYINGELVAENGQSLLKRENPEPINTFNCRPREAKDFRIPVTDSTARIRVIEAIEGQLITNEVTATGKQEDGAWIADTEQDILKIAVVNRYEPGLPIATAFIRNFGLKKGALASTVAHDCHNIVAVGATDDELCRAVNALIDARGGISVVDGAAVTCMPLPIAGLMSGEDGYAVAEQYAALDKQAKELGTTLKSPFMTLSFMALLVIPSLKLSDRGLFNGNTFSFTTVEL
ncbi:MAG: adenine deaminase [Flavipsychrobacter sp.]|nr:adenine deaminase [Flavipsychrobacter sp.]